MARLGQVKRGRAWLGSKKRLPSGLEQVQFLLVVLPFGANMEGRGVARPGEFRHGMVRRGLAWKATDKRDAWDQIPSVVIALRGKYGASSSG